MSRLFTSNPELGRAKKNIKLLLSPGSSNHHIPRDALNKIYVNPTEPAIDVHHGRNFEYKSEGPLDPKTDTFREEIAKKLIDGDSLTPMNYGRLLANEHLKLIEDNSEKLKHFLKDPTLLGESYYDPKTCVITSETGEVKKKRYNINGKNVSDLDNSLCGIIKIMDKMVSNNLLQTRFMDIHFNMIDRRLSAIEYQLGLNDIKTSNPPPRVRSLFDQLLDSVVPERSPSKTATEEIKDMKQSRLITPSSDIPILTLDGDGLEVVEVVANSSKSSNNVTKMKPGPKEPSNPSKTKNATKSRKTPRVPKKPQSPELIPEVSSDDSSLEYELSRTSRENVKPTNPPQNAKPLSYREKSLARVAASKKDGQRKDAPLFEVQPAPPANQSTLSSWVVPKYKIVSERLNEETDKFVRVDKDEQNPNQAYRTRYQFSIRSHTIGNPEDTRRHLSTVNPPSKSYSEIPPGPSGLAAPPSTPATENMEVDESPDKITPLEDLAPLVEYVNNDQAADFTSFENGLFEGISSSETSTKLDELIEYVSKMNDTWIQRQKVEKERQEAETKAQNAAKYKKLYELLRACAKETPNESQYGDPQYQSTEIWSPQPSSSGHRKKHTVCKEKNSK